MKSNLKHRLAARYWVDGSEIRRENQLIWVFPKIRVPRNGWFITENPIRMDDLGYHYFWKHPYGSDMPWIYRAFIPCQVVGLWGFLNHPTIWNSRTTHKRTWAKAMCICQKITRWQFVQLFGDMNKWCWMCWCTWTWTSDLYTLLITFIYHRYIPLKILYSF